MFLAAALWRCADLLCALVNVAERLDVWLERAVHLFDVRVRRWRLVMASDFSLNRVLVLDRLM